MNKALDAIVGGWEVSTTWRQTSGLPFSVSNGSRWATNWELSGYATPNGIPIPQTVSAHLAPGGFRRARAQPVERSEGRAGQFPD